MTRTPKMKGLAPGSVMLELAGPGFTGKDVSSLAIPWFLLQLLTATWTCSCSWGQPWLLIF